MLSTPPPLVPLPKKNGLGESLGHGLYFSEVFPMVTRKAPMPDMAAFLGGSKPRQPKPVVKNGDLLLFDVDQFAVKPDREQLDLFAQ